MRPALRKLQRVALRLNVLIRWPSVRSEVDTGTPTTEWVDSAQLRRNSNDLTCFPQVRQSIEFSRSVIWLVRCIPFTSGSTAPTYNITFLAVL
ncbi:hypothetical protein EDD18DRAFT_387671 [Armillaria luteobubalina]|uniref:Uncharacterized protein n=1 Tax=Armillaria luteobubalina TaxID=153913 RepID=A0AA39T974_9AGAR|nr:hypothetical protein EDD18DRAFT_387671 [Armillaria luteobubalina]